VAILLFVENRALKTEIQGFAKSSDETSQPRQAAAPEPVQYVQLRVISRTRTAQSEAAGESELPTVRPQPGAVVLAFQLPLEVSDAKQRYTAAVLNSDGEELASRSDLTAEAVERTPRVIAQFPVDLFDTGIYSIRLRDTRSHTAGSFIFQFLPE
jgi:hypothetical protein